MNPAWRPISLTSPIPLRTDSASVWAASIATFAMLTAVSNPNVLSTNGMSLSIVLGIPTTASSIPRRNASTAIACAPRIVPSPPIANRQWIPCAASVSTIASGACAPREHRPAMRVDMPDGLGHELDRRELGRGVEAGEPVSKANHRVDAVLEEQVEHE
jgi:hypothetical protein